MKILHIINSLNVGGAENLIYNILPKMSEKGYDVELLLLSSKDNNVHPINELEKHIKIHKSPHEKIRSFKQIKYIKSILNNQYDIVHSHLFPSLYFTAFASRKFKKTKFIYTDHNTNNKRRNKWYFKWMENKIYSKYDSIIAISDGVNRSLQKWLNNKNYSKVVTINNGIDIEKFQNAKPINKRDLIPNYKENDKLLLMVGSFSEQKDQNTIIKAMALIPDNYKLILVGDGHLRNNSEELVSKLKLNKKVFFLGLRNDVERITKTVDICIVSSHWEGFGLVAAEGMVAGKPVIDI